MVIVTLGFVVIVGVFVVVAIPPITHEFHVLVTNYPRYKSELVPAGGGRDGWRSDFHLTGYLTGSPS